MFLNLFLNSITIYFLLSRLSSAYSRLANTYWPQNIVIVTHGYGVREAVLKGDCQTDDDCTDYCSYVELNRSSRDSDKWTVVDVVGRIHCSPLVNFVYRC